MRYAAILCVVVMFFSCATAPRPKLGNIHATSRYEHVAWIENLNGDMYFHIVDDRVEEILVLCKGDHTNQIKQTSLTAIALYKSQGSVTGYYDFNNTLTPYSNTLTKDHASEAIKCAEERNLKLAPFYKTKTAMWPFGSTRCVASIYFAAAFDGDRHMGDKFEHDFKSSLRIKFF